MPFYVSAAAAVIGAAVTAYGTIQSSEASSASAKYNSEVATENAAIATKSAQLAGAAGEAQAEQSSLQTRAKVGGIIANQAAGNIDVNSVSALDVQSSARELGELNALTVRSNAAKTAYAYETNSAGDVAQSQLDQFQSQNDITSGEISAGGTVLGGIGSAASNYAKGAYGTSGGLNNNVSGNG